MTRRPDLFNQQAFEDALLELGCAQYFVKPITSDFKLFVPVVLKEIGENQLFVIVENSRSELKLGDQEAAWKLACKYIVRWAENEIEKYISQK